MNNQLLLDNLRCIPDWPIKDANDATLYIKGKMDNQTRTIKAKRISQ